MSARHRSLLPITATLLALSACSATGADVSSPAESAPSPAAAATGVSSVAATNASDDTAVSAGCPSTTTLDKLVDLPKGWSLASVECFKNWATATPKRTAPGDGVYLFKYEAGTGWRYHDEGSDWDCKDLGLDEGAPFCSS